MPADLALQIEALNAHLVDITAKVDLAAGLIRRMRFVIRLLFGIVGVLVGVIVLGAALAVVTFHIRADADHRACVRVNHVAHGETQLWGHVLGAQPAVPLSANPTPAERAAFEQRQRFEADLKTYFSPVKC